MKRIMFTFLCVVISISFGFAGKAAAMTVSVYDNIADSLLISPSTTPWTGSFTLNQALSSIGGHTTPYNVQWAKATFLFADDNDVTVSGTSVSPYTCVYSYPVYGYNWWGKQYVDHYVSYYERTSHTYYTDAGEGLEVRLEGGQILQGATTYYGFDQGYGASAWEQQGYSYYRTISYGHTTGYKGSFSLEAYLNGPALAELSNSGALTFSLMTGSSGDLYYVSGRLDVGLSDLLDGGASVPAPVPPAVLLLASGLAGLLMIRRRSHRG